MNNTSNRNPSILFEGRAKVAIFQDGRDVYMDIGRSMKVVDNGETIFLGDMKRSQANQLLSMIPSVVKVKLSPEMGTEKSDYSRGVSYGLTTALQHMRPFKLKYAPNDQLGEPEVSDVVELEVYSESNNDLGFDLMRDYAKKIFTFRGRIAQRL